MNNIYYYNLGPIVEPTLPQSIPQPQPQPDSKPPTEIPMPNKTTITAKEVQRNIEDDVLFEDVCIFIIIK